MKNLCIVTLLLLPVFAIAQVGIKAGYNYSNITNASQINASGRSGFHAGAFLSPASKSIFTSRTELIYSRQGYNFASSTNTGSVDLDYLIIPQLMGVNITKYLQLQAGFQVAYLLNAKADSAKNTSTTPSTASIMDLYNRFDYGLGVGVELHPLKGLIISGRANFSLGKMYKETPPGQMPSFIPDVKTKNNVIQLSVGWSFGKS